MDRRGGRAVDLEVRVAREGRELCGGGSVEQVITLAHETHASPNELCFDDGFESSAVAPVAPISNVTKRPLLRMRQNHLKIELQSHQEMLLSGVKK